MANRPKMLRQLLRELMGRQDDMDVVGEALDPLEILLAVRRTEADIVVTSLPESGAPAISSHLLAEYPHLVVLALAPERDRAVVYRQVLVERPIERTSDNDLLATLRQAISEAPEDDEVPRG